MSDTQEKLDLFMIRDFKESDKAFVLATWLRGLRYGNDWFEFIAAEPYFRLYQDVIESILKRTDVKTSVACLKDDEDVIVGYSVYRYPDRLDWVFVKNNWRKIGIAKSLVPSTITTVSHVTDQGRRIMEKKYPKLIFNPFI